MADRQESIEDHVTCSICMDLYTDPLALPCMHSFCRNCLRGIYSAALTLKCPECRTDIKLGKKGIDGLSKNFQLGSIVESYKRDHGTELTNTARSNETSARPFCAQHRMTCHLLCITCKKPICLTCVVERHSGHKLKLTDSSREEIGDLEEQQVCKQHSRKFKLFCSDCDALVCLECLIKQHHTHTLSTIENTYGYNSEILSGSLAELDSRQRLLRATQKTCRTLAQKTQIDAQKKRQELAMYFGRIRDSLDKREAAMKAELERRERQTVDGLMQRSDVVHKKENQINHVVDDVKRLLTEDKFRFLQNYKSRASRISFLLTDESTDGTPQNKGVDDVTLITCSMEKEFANIQWQWPKAAEMKPARKAPPVPRERKLETLLRTASERQIPSLQIGWKVQRGQHWKDGMVDGGPGHFGTVTQTTIDPTVYLVRWPNGYTGSYRYAPPDETQVTPP